MTAQKIWDRDDNKKRLLEGVGYKVEVVWENTNKKFRHSTKS
jgi:G:T-mismatch repair DNA endonuclease (very short patch repair protein)